MSAPTTSRRHSQRRDRTDDPGPLATARAAIRRSLAAVLTPVRRLIRAVTRGDKPLVVGVLVILGLGIVMLSGPLQSYLDHRARSEVLQMQADVLAAENEKLEERADALLEDETVELLAREQQGFIRPGEVPYALTPPEVERPRITVPRTDHELPEPPWYARAWDAVQSLFGR